MNYSYQNNDTTFHVDEMLSGVRNRDGQSFTVRQPTVLYKSTPLRPQERLVNMCTVSINPLVNQNLVFYIHAAEETWVSRNPQNKGEPYRFEFTDILDSIHRLRVPEGIYINRQTSSSGKLPSVDAVKDVQITCQNIFNSCVHYVVISDQTEKSHVAQSYPAGTVFIHFFQILYFDRQQSKLCHPNEILTHVVDTDHQGFSRRLVTLPDPLVWEIHDSQKNKLSGSVLNGSMAISQNVNSKLFHPVEMSSWQLQCMNNMASDLDEISAYNKVFEGTYESNMISSGPLSATLSQNLSETYALDKKAINTIGQEMFGSEWIFLEQTPYVVTNRFQSQSIDVKRLSGK
jgi:hypothetical protein